MSPVLQRHTAAAAHRRGVPSLASSAAAPAPAPPSLAPAQVLLRRNSVTGRAYRDDPTLLAFNLINEPRCSGYEVRREGAGQCVG